ncbi:MAG: hypothetical protein O3C28_18510 [Proteobacteria bacterium]|nr:hypothetical protein [Pseudomonadota bacterium]
MKIQIQVINPVTQTVVFEETFANSIDANSYRDILDTAGSEYRVCWDCQ